jgi:hypothetical protein
MNFVYKIARPPICSLEKKTALWMRAVEGAGGGNRTHKSVRTREFESRASASSATPAIFVFDGGQYFNEQSSRGQESW